MSRKPGGEAAIRARMATASGIEPHVIGLPTYLDVLREWAASAEGVLSGTHGPAAREHQPDWPKRDTLAFAIGDWHEALRSAGLESRAARRPSAR